MRQQTTGILLGLILSVGAGAATITSTRTFYDATGANQVTSYAVGIDVTVQITTQYTGNMNLFTAQDLLPDGWTCVSVASGGVYNSNDNRVSWTINGTPVTVSYVARPAGSGTVTFTGAVGGFGDGVVVSGTIPDTDLQENQPPSAPGIELTGSADPVTTVADLTCTITTPSVDADNNPAGGGVEYRYLWKDGFGPVSQTDWTTATTHTLPASTTTKGEWTCEVVARDGLGTESSAASATITVQDTAPTAPTHIQVTPSKPEPDDDIVASAIGSTDADGDSITYLYNWTRISPSATTYQGATLPASQTVLGDIWELEAAASADGAVSSYTAYGSQIKVTTYHSADADQDGRISMIEYLGYAGPAAAVWQMGANGGEYEWDGTTLSPKTE